MGSCETLAFFHCGVSPLLFVSTFYLTRLLDRVVQKVVANRPNGPLELITRGNTVDTKERRDLSEWSRNS